MKFRLLTFLQFIWETLFKSQLLQIWRPYETWSYSRISKYL